MESSSKIRKYIEEHTTPESPILRELNRQTHVRMLMPRMLSGHIQGKVLEMISKMTQPENILELGTYTGYSAICLAKGLKDGGAIHTIELNDELETFIREYLRKSEVEDMVVLHIGDALQIIETLDIQFDMVFIDADKRQYLDYYDAVFDKVKNGGYILADNVLWSGKVVEQISENDDYTNGILKFNEAIQNDDRVENVLFPFRDGLMVIRKK